MTARLLVLLAVIIVRPYAPGIQFCYENELTRDPALEGKLVVALTVSAMGAVEEVRTSSPTASAPTRPT